MPAIRSVDGGFYRIALDAPVADATHGVMRGFEIVTVRVVDADGVEGAGYTFTTGRNGGAVHSVVAREIAELAQGKDADRIERVWHDIWWALHYGGRGGPTVLALSAFDIALWDLKAKRAKLRCGSCSAVSAIAFRVMPAASTFICPSTRC